MGPINWLKQFLPKRKRGLREGLGDIAADTFGKYVTEFRGFNKLDSAKKLRIALESWDEVDRALELFEKEKKADFEPILFWVSEMVDKKTQLKLYKTCVVFDVNGFVIKDTGPEGEEELMHVVLPERIRKKDRNLGCIKHPEGTILYRIGRAAGGPRVKEVLVQKATGDDIGSTSFRVTAIPNPFHVFVLCLGGCMDTHDYFVKHGKDKLAKIKPRFAFFGPLAYTVKYYDKCGDQQKRAAILGYALMLVLVNGYPELVNLMATKKRGGYGSADSY